MFRMFSGTGVTQKGPIHKPENVGPHRARYFLHYSFNHLTILCVFFRFALSCNTRGHCYKLFAEQSTHNVRYHFLPDVLLVRGIDFLSILTFLLQLDLKLLSNVLICQTVCYIVSIKVVVSAPHGAFLFLTDLVLFLSAYECPCHCQWLIIIIIIILGIGYILPFYRSLNIRSPPSQLQTDSTDHSSSSPQHSMVFM